MPMIFSDMIDYRNEQWECNGFIIFEYSQKEIIFKKTHSSISDLNKK